MRKPIPLRLDHDAEGLRRLARASEDARCAPRPPPSIVSIPPAMAGEDGTNPNTVFSEIPGVIAHAPAQTSPAIDTAQPPQSAQTRSGHGGWLFPPIGNYLSQRPAKVLGKGWLSRPSFSKCHASLNR
jgi:hypothetical protein